MLKGTEDFPFFFLLICQCQVTAKFKINLFIITTSETYWGSFCLYAFSKVERSDDQSAQREILK